MIAINNLQAKLILVYLILIITFVYNSFVF